MSEKAVFLSREGLRRLEEELEYLRSIRRKEVAARIKQARENGDIAENSEYEDAKNEQAFVEGRILTLEKMLRNAQVLEVGGGPPGVVTLGCRVRLLDLETQEVEEYWIVGTLEANPAENRISDESPVGRALLGRAVGDEVEVEVPVGTLRYRILEVEA
ncbi:MAG: transcription elongation factor GreA [Bacillota bacterium]|nr:MAG: transcription elongation factor GreA [Bacillota bacterium]